VFTRERDSYPHPATPINREYIKVFKMLTFIISAALAAAAAATDGSGASAQLQLETPRVAQFTQRIEFGANGPNFPFKFSFLDPVRPFPTRTCHWSIGRLH
jgi:hypothetical protein